MNPIERFHVTIHRPANSPAILMTKASSRPIPPDETELLRRVRGICFPDNGYISPLNLFFHYLPSGNSALGRLLPNGPYGSGEPFSPQSYSVEYLLISPEVLRRFQNNPTLLFQTLLENGQIAPFAGGIPSAHPVELPIPDTRLDEALLDGLAVAPGSTPLAFLLQSVLDSITTCFTGTPSPLHLVSALFSLLPVDWRPELSFTLGVPFSEEFPWRLVFIPAPSTQQNSAPKNSAPITSSTNSTDNSTTSGKPAVGAPVVPQGVPLIHLEELSRATTPPAIIDGWPLFIKEVLDHNQYAFLQSCYETAFPGNTAESNDFAEQRTTVEDINHIGFSSLFELKHILGGESGEMELFGQLTGRKPHSGLEGPGSPKRIEHEQPLAMELGDGHILSPYQQLVASWPSLDAELLRFDSLVAHALDGDYGAMDQLRRLWDSMAVEKDESLLWLIREEYTRYIRTYLIDESDKNESRNLHKTYHSLEVLELLFQKTVPRPE